jgi:hypothetical protein
MSRALLIGVSCLLLGLLPSAGKEVGLDVDGLFDAIDASRRLKNSEAARSAPSQFRRPTEVGAGPSSNQDGHSRVEFMLCFPLDLS